MPADPTVLYRITHERYREAPFSGEGGLRYNSRWASKGRRVSYAADHLATATLEKIAGVQRADLLTEMVFVKAEIDPTHVTTLPERGRPEGWDQIPPAAATRAVGDAWLEEEESVLLRVPAVVLPHSSNYVVNPAHEEAGALRVVETKPLLMDNRVLRHLGVSQE